MSPLTPTCVCWEEMRLSFTTIWQSSTWWIATSMLETQNRCYFVFVLSMHLTLKSTGGCSCVTVSVWPGLPPYNVPKTPRMQERISFGFLNSRTARPKIPKRFPEKLTGRITAKDSRQTTVMSKMMWRWKDRYVTASMPHLLRISSSLQKQYKPWVLILNIRYANI